MVIRNSQSLVLSCSFYRTGRYFFLVSTFFTIIFLNGAASAFAATIYANSSTGNDSTGNGSSGAPYATFTKAYTAASNGDTINLTGTFDWSNAAETGDAVTTGFTIAKNLIITGQSATTTFIQAASSYNTGSERVFTVAANASTTIENLTVRYGTATGSNSGGCLDVNSGATLLILNANVSYCHQAYAYSGGGGMYSYNATTTISKSSFTQNYAVGSGGALYVAGSSGTLTMVDATLANNTAASGSGGGGGMWFQDGNAYLANTTIARNTGGYGGGIDLYYSGIIHLENSIIADNTGSGSTNIYKQSGSYTSSGHNIVGAPTSYMTETTGDWMWASGVTSDSGNFQLYSVGTTGSLNLDTGSGINDSKNGTYTVALLAGSIAINNGTNTAAGSVAVPALDERGAGRNGTTDIGAFEYDGTGLTIGAPTVQAAGVTFSSATYKQLAVSWTAGDGSRRVVFMKAGTTGTALPVNGTQYTTNSRFGLGSQIGSSGWYAVYDGVSSTSVTVTGLSAATTYIAQVFEYNGIGSGQSVYQTATASGNPGTGSTYTPTTIYVNSATGNDTTGTGSSGAPYATFTKAYSVANGGDTINLTGTINLASAAETGDAAISGFTLGKDVIITGQGAASTVIEASSTSATADRRIFTIGSSASTTIENLQLRNGYVTGNNYGGCILTGAGTTLALLRVDIHNCQSPNATYGNGGGISSAATTTIIDSSIHDNVGGYSGGALYMGGAGSWLSVVNSTIYDNSNLSGSGGGSGFWVGYGTAYFTNDTITANSGSYGGGITSYWSAAVHLENTILAGNSGNSSGTNFYAGMSGTFSSNGYNVIGKGYGITATTGDWVDSTDSGTFTLHTVGTTGSLSLASAAALNSNARGTYTYAITSASSIVIDNATTTANGSVAVPSFDQRGASRSGATDIGAYEYGGGGLDTTAPTVSVTAPTASSTVTGANVALSANASDNVAVSGVTFYVDGTRAGSEDTTPPYSIVWNSTATTSGLKSVVAVAADTSGNTATSSTVSFTVNNAVTPTSITATTSASGATISWDTTTAGSSRVFFGLLSSAASSTAPADSRGVTSHSVSLSDLPACAVYKYVTVSSNTGGDVATSSQYTFDTAGCTGGASITTHGEGALTTAVGGVLAEGNLTLTVPVSFTATSSSATFQASQLDNTAFVAAAGAPSGMTRVGTDVFHLAAFINQSTVLSTFTSPLTVTFAYNASDVSGLDTSTLKIYRYDAPSWTALTNCSVNTSARTVSCETSGFSDFAIFGQAATVQNSDSTTSSGGGVILGCTDRAALNYSPYAFGANTSSCVYAPRYAISTHGTATTTTVSPTPVALSYTRDLTVGDAGAEVTALQRFLIAGGYAIRAGATGYFGLQTKAALAAYQKAAGISPAAGYFGPVTRAAISRTVVAALVSPTSEISTSTPSPFTRDLSLGDIGADVKALQVFLNAHGFTVAKSGDGSQGDETDYFGPLTKAALAKFQSAHGIAPSRGYFGPITRAFIEAGKF